MKFACLSVALLAGLFVGAQQPPRSAGIAQSAVVEGYVTTEEASALPGANIGLDSLTHGYHRSAVADVSGHYLMDELQPGAYSLFAEVKGQGCILLPHVTLQPGQHLRQDFHFTRSARYPNACAPAQSKGKSR